VPTDTAEIVRNLAAFYDFDGKRVVAVGAGGGQLIEYARPAHHVVAVDKDAAAITRLSERVAALGMAYRFTFVTADFMTVPTRGDVVLFEFCLHQMEEPERALDRARSVAPEVLVIDHAPFSRWEWYAAEEAKVAAGWKAALCRAPQRRQSVEALQYFENFSELEARLALQGSVSRERIEALRGQTSIRIDMPYWIALF
jgi:ubiquinone/menaquinone biosynthesis C-methylase UbiE